MNEEREEIVGSLLTIGDEILLGDIPNGNAHHIASELRSAGFRLDRMITMGDREEEIVEVLCRCVERSRFIIATGGLGPTDDDRTNEAVAEAFQLPLVPHVAYTQWLEHRLAERGRAWTDNLARMVRLPQGAVKLGLETAGFFIEHKNVPCYFLPGVPHEMKELLDQTVIPDLKVRFPDRLVYLKHLLRIQGVPESEINGKVKEIASADAGFQIGYLPQTGENWVTIFAAATTAEEARSRIDGAKREIELRLGPGNVSGHNEDSLEVVVGRRLLEKSWRLAFAESCTGGLLSMRLTAVPGASDYFERAFITYSNQAKTDLLGVPKTLLEAHGAVSEQVALAMADGGRARAGVDVAVAITGIAGPSGGSLEKPVGTVFIACATPQRSVVESHFFSGDRTHIREKAAQAALVLLWRTLSDDPNIHRN
jgi:nicotinamide-nucleotide amidase